MPNLNPNVLLGSQYYVNTEETPEHVRAGIAAMARAGLKLVRIFLQWDHVELKDGRWDWSQYDALFDAAADGGLGVIVTLTAVHPPGWMKITFGPQDMGPLEDPNYWERAKDYIRRVVARYGMHPAMQSWILSNEPKRILPENAEILARYQRFLQAKYRGDIQQLNMGAFQRLDRFDEISFPSVESGFSSYIGRLNWLHFNVYRMQQVLAEIKDVIRETDNTHPVHVNPHSIVGDMFREGQSIWSEGRLVDFLGCSAHPSWHSTRFLPDRLHQSVGLLADLMRGATQAQNRYFWVTELQGGTNIYSGVIYLGPSGEDLRSWMWEAIGAGAKAVVFWCFNTRTQGFEAGEWGLLDQQGRPSQRLNVVSELAAFLEQHAKTFATSQPARAPIALLYSEATWRLGAAEGQNYDPENPRNAIMGADALTGAWQACADAGLSVDIMDEVDLWAGRAADYPILILPGCTALEDASFAALRAYVENGGTLLADGLCGYKNEDGWMRDVARSSLNEIFGASVADIQAVPERNTFTTFNDLSLPVWFLKVILEPEAGVTVRARFSEPNPRPALTVNQFGQGRAIRLGTVFFQHYFRHPAPEAFAELAALLPLPYEPVHLENASPHLRLRRLSLPEGEVLILLNGGLTTEAILNVAEKVSLWRLTPHGEEQVNATGRLNVSMPTQSTEVFRANYTSYRH